MLRPLCALAALAFAAGPAFAQPLTWVPIGPEGGSVTTVVVDPRTPSRVLAGTLGGGVLRTVDGAASWQWTNGPFVNYVPKLVAHPTQANTFYAATDFGLMLTTTSGDFWDPVPTGLSGPLETLVALAIDPTTPTTLYVGSNAGTVGASAAVLKTTNAGGCWSTLMLGTNDSTVSTLAIDPSAPQTVWAGTSCCNGGVFKSTNGGTSWAAMNTGLGTLLIDTIVVDPSASLTVLAATALGLYRTADGGATFSAVAGGLPAQRLSALAVGPGPVFWAAIDSTLYSSSDHGVTWSAKPPIAAAATVQGIAVDPTNAARLFVGTAGTGVYESTDTGATWAAKNTGFTATWVTALASIPASAPTSLLLGTHDTGAFRTDNRGASWSVMSLPKPVTLFAAEAASPNTLYAIANGVLQKSTDGGAGWDAKTTGLPMGAAAVAVAPSMPSTLFVCRCGDNVYKSTDGADSFTPAGMDVVGRCAQSLGVSGSDPNRVVVSAGGGHPDDAVMFSANGGTSWADGGGIPSTVIPGQVAVDQTNPPRFYVAASGGIAGVFTSTDQGVSWSHCAGITGEVSSLVVDPSTHNLFVGALGHVFESVDHCATSIDVTADLFNADVTQIAQGVPPDILYAGTFANGVFALRLGDAGTPDAGTRDGGTTSNDGGATQQDGGSTSSDGGSTSPDGGSVTQDDGGTPKPDAGTTATDDGGLSTLSDGGGSTPGLVQGVCGCSNSGGLLDLMGWLALALLKRRQR